VKVLLLSAYDAQSHARWRKGLVKHLADHEFIVHALPARWFSWRTGSAALTWATNASIWEHDYDLVLTTSMTDVAALRGLNRSLSNVPIVSYFHENQFAYPVRDQRPDARLLIQSIQGAMAADLLVFNSQYNRSTFVDGACAFIASMPDHQPMIRSRLEQRSLVLPVPLEAACFEQTSGPRMQRLVWNHRWEWDKAPERFFSALRILKDRGVTPRVAFVGQAFRAVPETITKGLEEFADQLDFVGFQPRDRYREILQTSSHVVSTALHEFQGLAVAEACAAGCVPVVPDRLSYAEIFQTPYRYPSFPDDADQEAAALADRLEVSLIGGEEPPNLRHLAWEKLGPDYAKVMIEALSSMK
jgi:glycosyltransferase involved in cell wall biosynthesis